jgi:hypothetical protein
MEMVEAAVGRPRGPGDACRRYRPVQFTFDTRAAVLDTVIGDDWDPGIQEQWRGLGERILNDLIRDLRTDYDDHSATARVRGKESVDKWPTAIRVLREWGVLTDSLADDYLRLGRLRNAAVHYRPRVEAVARENALEAVLLLQRLVEGLFTPLGGPPLFIDGITGSSFLARAPEDLPLVRRYYLPNAVLVSPRYDVRPGDRPGLFLYYDDADYGGPDRCDGMTDEQFADALRGDGATA